MRTGWTVNINFVKITPNFGLSVNINFVTEHGRLMTKLMFPEQNYCSLDKIYVHCQKRNHNHKNDYLSGNHPVFKRFFRYSQSIRQIQFALREQ